MNNLNLSGPGPYDSDPDNEFVAKYDPYIRKVARNVITPGIFSQETLDLELDELSQIILIKFWKAHQKRSITHPRAYIKMVAQTAMIDIMRRHKPTLSLGVDEHGEALEVDRFVSQQEGLRDPAYEIELRQIDEDLLTQLVDLILSLPPRQKQAILYVIQEHQQDTLPLIRAFQAQGIDLEAVAQSECEEYLLKASLSVARKKLQCILKQTA